MNSPFPISAKSDEVKDADKINKRVAAEKKVEETKLLISKNKPATAKVLTNATKNATTNTTNKTHSKVAPSKTKPLSFLQATETNQAFLSTVARVQFTSKAAKEHVATFLEHEGVRLKSVVLSSVASQVAKDPFVKVKKTHSSFARADASRGKGRGHEAGLLRH
jgi:hypothetical protein